MTNGALAFARTSLHPVTWVIWTGWVAVLSILTRNPLYLSLLLGVVLVHYLSLSQRRPEAQGWNTLLRLALWMALLVIPFNALTIHAGRHVLFRLPAHWPLIGGSITLEGVVAGAVNVLGLLTLIVLFATFNLQISQAQLLRLTPAFVYEAGLIVSIALTFIPQMMVSSREIREAQLVRGHRMRRPRDMLPYLMALLTTGLERSFQLAESLEARGFGNARDLSRRLDLLLKALTLLGLAGFLSGFFVRTYFQSLRWAGWIAVALSTALLLGVFWAQGRRVLRVHYRRDRWTWPDGVVLVACLAVAVLLVLVRLQDPGVLVYSPYQQLLPPFHPLVGVALILLIAPVLFGLSGQSVAPRGHSEHGA
jgi:energy-coupling factor transport system permease protein